MSLVNEAPRSIRLSALVIAAFALVLGLWLALPHRESATTTAISDLLQLAGPLLILPWAFGPLAVLWRTRRPAAQAPVWLALGILCNAAGQLAWTWYEVVLHHPDPFPSWADLFYLLAYPCFLLGIVHLPSAGKDAIGRTRLIFDGLMVMLAAATLSWYFILGPTLLQSDVSRLSKIVGAAYPLADLVLVGCVLALLARALDPLLRWAAGLLTLGLGIIILTDSIFDYLSLHTAYSTGGLLDLGWPLSDMLVALGIQVLLWALLEQRDRTALPALGTVPRLWRVLLPYACLPLLFVLLIVSRFTTPSNGPLDTGLVAGSLALTLVVIARQVLAISENRRLQATTTSYARRLEAVNADLFEANARLEALATTDPVTGLPNHRALMAALQRELDRGARYERPFALLFLDLDHFKSINDSHGHAAGDDVLIEFGVVLRGSLRDVDIAGRWGGEEFLAILPEMELADALAAAERVRGLTALRRCAAGGGLHLTCSIGVSCYPSDAVELERLVALADQALYTAKKLGRNQVRAASDPAVVALLAEADEPREARSLAGTVEALAAIVEARDPLSASRGERVAGLALHLSLACGLSATEARMLALVGRILDIGKVAIPDAILLKPGALSADEWTIMRTHPLVGADVVGRVPALRALAPLVRGHHERWDGRGYPDGLASEDIPLGARILAVADAYTALTSDRPYRHHFPMVEALAIVQREAGTRFDPRVSAHLEAALSKLSTVTASSAGTLGAEPPATSTPPSLTAR